MVEEDKKNNQKNVKKKINLLLILKSNHVKLTIVALISSVFTFIFFYFSNHLIKDEKINKKEIDIYKIAKEEAIKQGRLEPDEKKEIPVIGPDGKVIIPSLTYYDIGGMGPNSNKSFVSNIKDSKNYLSMEIAFSSYEGEKLGDLLKEHDPQFRNIIMMEIDNRKTSDFIGSKNRNKFLSDVRDKMNEFLIMKDEEPIIFNAILKKFVINQH